ASVAVSSAAAEAPERGAEYYLRVLALGAKAPGGAEGRELAVQALAAMGEKALPQLLEGLKNENPSVRSGAAQALGRMRAKAAAEPLMELLKDASGSVRAAAAEALGLMRDPRAVVAMLAMLGSDQELDRRAAIVGLGRARAQEAVAELITALSDESWEVRWRAALALGQIGQKTATGGLQNAIADDDPVVAACAAWAQAKIAGRPTFIPLSRALENQDARVVWASAWALGVIGSREAVQALAKTLTEGSDTARPAAKLVLTWLGTPEARAALKKAAAPVPIPEAPATPPAEPPGEARTARRTVGPAAPAEEKPAPPALTTGAAPPPVSLGLVSALGQVETRAPGSEQWQRARRGGALEVGGLLRTGPKSRAHVRLAGGIQLHLAEDTTIDRRADKLVLWQGRIWCSVGPVKREALNFAVSTRDGSAFASEGRFSVRTSKEGGTFVSVSRGSATVRAQGQVATVGEQQQVAISPGQPPSAPGPLGIEEQAAWLAFAARQPR
ncbi:MAG: HEAT repeat domain-containing protein, partial [Armatimonadota bacterium]